MSYREVDLILLPWLKRHGLHVFTRDREYEVRHIDVVDDSGDRYQIGIAEPDDSGMLKVFAGNYERKRKQKAQEYPSNLSHLDRTLEEAYAKIMEWVGQAQHTRTPVL
jgi:hypothetical protein